VPGCLDEDPGASDYCVFPEYLPDQPVGAKEESWHNGFMIKLHWEEGNMWQNETIERKCKVHARVVLGNRSDN
jgi:hypothetical protein